MMGKLLGGLIIILLMASLIGPIAEKTKVVGEGEEFRCLFGINHPCVSTNMLIKFVPGFFAIIILIIAIFITGSALTDAGLIGAVPFKKYREDYNEIIRENPNHKQTYKEYVEERLEVERMMR